MTSAQSSASVTENFNYLPLKTQHWILLDSQNSDYLPGLLHKVKLSTSNVRMNGKPMLMTELKHPLAFLQVWSSRGHTW